MRSAGVAQRDLAQRQHREGQPVADDQRAGVVGEPGDQGLAGSRRAASATAPGASSASTATVPAISSGGNTPITKKSRGRTASAAPTQTSTKATSEKSVRSRRTPAGRASTTTRTSRRGGSSDQADRACGPLPRASCGGWRQCSHRHRRAHRRGSGGDAPYGGPVSSAGGCRSSGQLGALLGDRPPAARPRVSGRVRRRRSRGLRSWAPTPSVVEAARRDQHPGLQRADRPVVGADRPGQGPAEPVEVAAHGAEPVVELAPELVDLPGLVGEGLLASRRRRPCAAARSASWGWRARPAGRRRTPAAPGRPRAPRTGTTPRARTAPRTPGSPGSARQ